VPLFRSILSVGFWCMKFADGPRVHHVRSIFLGALLEVRVAISEGPHPPRGQSVPSSRTVRPDTVDSPPGAFQIA
jgi:hypothetical protein